MMGTARLVQPNEPMAFSAVQETDARTALSRGLAQYLAQHARADVKGREIRLQKVFDSWSEPEEMAAYPALTISAGPGAYDASKLTPTASNRERLLAPDGRYVVSHCEFTCDLTVELWTNDPVERRSLVASMEAVLNPMMNIYGLVLELPFYFNQRALFELRSMTYMDTEIDAMRRYRKASFIVAGSVPVTQLFSLPEARPRLKLEEVGVNVVVSG